MVNGTNICQQVTISAPRPNMNGCLFSPFGIWCQTSPPPLPLDPYEVMPPGNQPWFSQRTCNWVNFLDTERQIPEKEEAPPEFVDWADVVAWATACIARAQAKALACMALLPMTGKEAAIACTEQALADGNFCLDELNRRRDQ